MYIKGTASTEEGKTLPIQSAERRLKRLSGQRSYHQLRPFQYSQGTKNEGVTFQTNFSKRKKKRHMSNLATNISAPQIWRSPVLTRHMPPMREKGIMPSTRISRKWCGTRTVLQFRLNNLFSKTPLRYPKTPQISSITKLNNVECFKKNLSPQSMGPNKGFQRQRVNLSGILMADACQKGHNRLSLSRYKQ